MRDIVRLINLVLGDDHRRNCDGRTYSCTCGYDLKVIEAAEKAHAEVTRMRAEVSSQPHREGDEQTASSQK